MKNRFTTLRRGALALVLAVTIALLSVFVERTGPELVQYGNTCGPGATDPCYKSVLKGGFPVAFLFDAPGISVEGRLSFGEDDLSPGALILDIAAYFAIALLAVRAVTRSRS